MLLAVAGKVRGTGVRGGERKVRPGQIILRRKVVLAATSLVGLLLAVAGDDAGRDRRGKPAGQARARTSGLARDSVHRPDVPGDAVHRLAAWSCRAAATQEVEAGPATAMAPGTCCCSWSILLWIGLRDHLGIDIGDVGAAAARGWPVLPAAVTVPDAERRRPFIPHWSAASWKCSCWPSPSWRSASWRGSILPSCPSAAGACAVSLDVLPCSWRSRTAWTTCATCPMPASPSSDATTGSRESSPAPTSAARPGRPPWSSCGRR